MQFYILHFKNCHIFDFVEKKSPNKTDRWEETVLLAMVADIFAETSWHFKTLSEVAEAN